MKSNLYTRTGDAGDTSLCGGQRVRKNSKRIDAYGNIDELSSALGTVAADKSCPQEVAGQIRQIQNELFELGGNLATDPTDSATLQVCKGVDNAAIQNLEGWIDALDEQTPKINAFVLPGGAPAAAQAHLARTICRRAERAMLDLADSEPVDADALKYINRLSDYLFIAARYINFMAGEAEVVWKPRAKQ
ncbi:MAG: cob(I)yrinic acid a,c-diamide adenosyltransferase [Muribaculaceae bacterium]|nr:cob(I)yrinic acid a,c-diamide adenosyltransferase [Muribaculaceae bacterium]